MQQQKTAPQKIEISKPLNPQEMKFIEAIASGADNTEAYRQAYGAEGYSPAALRVQACRKAAEAHIRATLDSLRSVGLANARLTLETRIEEERAFAQRCEASGNMGAAGGAYDRLNKLMGLYVEKYEDATKQDPLAALKAIAEQSPDMAAELARQNGINWPTNDSKPH